MADTIEDFSQSVDATIWAAEFVKRAKADATFATDEGTMLAWFANAIMRGYDAAAAATRSSSGERFGEDETRTLNQAAAVLQGVLAVNYAEQQRLAARLFEIAGNPLPRDTLSSTGGKP
jgi:hypothetical protein